MKGRDGVAQQGFVEIDEPEGWKPGLEFLHEALIGGKVLKEADGTGPLEQGRKKEEENAEVKDEEGRPDQGGEAPE